MAFEIIGNENYLGERQHTRGANATTVDAVMIGKKMDGMNILVPEKNKELPLQNTSPGLEGENLKDAWLNVLKTPDRFRIISPEKLLEPLKNEFGTETIFKYLEKRYWN